MKPAVVSIILAFIGVALVAVLVSNVAKTGDVLGTAGGSFARMLRCALSPITGADCGTQTSSSISFG